MSVTNKILGRGGIVLGFLMMASLIALAWFDTSRLTLESVDGRRVSRKVWIGPEGRAYIVKQLSDTKCVQDRTWGYDEDSIWVDDGCRAVFEIYIPDEDGSTLFEGQFTLESKDGRRVSRRLNGGLGVRLVRRLSSAPCDQGRSWDYNKREVWVDDGCRAVFELIRKEGGRPGGPIRDGYEDDRWLYVQVESDGRRTTRNIPAARSVAKFRQISRQPCIFGKTWGNTRNTIWVDDGCRALFKVRKR